MEIGYPSQVKAKHGTREADVVVVKGDQVLPTEFHGGPEPVGDLVALEASLDGQHGFRTSRGQPLPEPGGFLAVNRREIIGSFDRNTATPCRLVCGSERG